MADKFKLEIVILVCACLTGVICEALITTKPLSSLSLCGGMIGIMILLFVIAIFTSISVNEVSENKKDRRKMRNFYGSIGFLAIMMMLLPILFGAVHTMFWVVISILWSFACLVRVAILWDWF
jgi:Mg2+/Co2+ transporter CorB